MYKARVCAGILHTFPPALGRCHCLVVLTLVLRSMCSAHLTAWGHPRCGVVSRRRFSSRVRTVHVSSLIASHTFISRLLIAQLSCLPRCAVLLVCGVHSGCLYKGLSHRMFVRGCGPPADWVSLLLDVGFFSGVTILCLVQGAQSGYARSTNPGQPIQTTTNLQGTASRVQTLLHWCPRPIRLGLSDSRVRSFGSRQTIGAAQIADLFVSRKSVPHLCPHVGHPARILDIRRTSVTCFALQVLPH